MSNRKLRNYVAIILVTGLATPMVGLAASPSQVYDDPVTVSYSDLDINSLSGAQTLYSRLQRATEEFCGVESYTTIRSVRVVADARACFAGSLSAAVEKIDSDTLTSIHTS